MNQGSIPVKNSRPLIKSELNHHSFSFEKSQNEDSHADMKGPDDHNNTTKYKYTKMLQDFELKQSKDQIMRTF